MAPNGEFPTGKEDVDTEDDEEYVFARGPLGGDTPLDWLEPETFNTKFALFLDHQLMPVWTLRRARWRPNPPRYSVWSWTCGKVKCIFVSYCLMNQPPALPWSSPLHAKMSPGHLPCHWGRAGVAGQVGFWPNLTSCNLERMKYSDDDSYWKELETWI